MRRRATDEEARKARERARLLEAEVREARAKLDALTEQLDEYVANLRAFICAETARQKGGPGWKS